MRRSMLLPWAAGALAVLPGCPHARDPGPPRAATDARPDRWAQPIVGKKGLSNLHKVDDGLYRGAQPEEEGFAELKKMGIRTVLNLRTFNSDRKDCERAGLDYVEISVQAWNAEEDEVLDFLRVVTDAARAPVFVHCQHGADRTGMMVAIYRIVVEGWSKDQAIEEMTRGGFGFHAVWTNLVDHVRQLDANRLRTKAGLADR